MATPPLQSSLAELIRTTGLKRASVEHWCATLASLQTKGLKAEELSESGVLTRLKRSPPGASVTQAQILRMIDLRHVAPKLVCESRFGFTAQAGWLDCCKRIAPKEYKCRGMQVAGQGVVHLRFLHRSLGWSIVRTRYRDLITERTDWWSVLDDKGILVAQGTPGFESPDDAIEFAELQISQRFERWGRDHALTKWERFSLPGGDGYRELLLQVDDWARSYQPRHYRTLNVLVHIRTSLRQTETGRHVLFLDEIQNDWHADLHAEAKPAALKKRDTPPSEAPFSKEWPLLSMKVMLWWAQQLGAEGLAWSSAELQSSRWRGYGPPETLYRKILPEAAIALAKTLDLTFETTSHSVRAYSRTVALSQQGWHVRGQHGTPVTKPFPTRAQAERFADETGDFVALDFPVLWIDKLAPIASLPLYGVGSVSAWLGPNPKRVPPPQPSATLPKTVTKDAKHAS